MTSNNKFLAGKVKDFVGNSMSHFVVAGHNVLLILQEGQFYALEDKCTHDNNVLHDGELLEGKVKCARHGATFNLKTGQATMPAIRKVRIYQTKVEQDKVYILFQEN